MTPRPPNARPLAPPPKTRARPPNKHTHTYAKPTHHAPETLCNLLGGQTFAQGVADVTGPLAVGILLLLFFGGGDAMESSASTAVSAFFGKSVSVH